MVAAPGRRSAFHARNVGGRRWPPGAGCSSPTPTAFPSPTCSTASGSPSPRRETARGRGRGARRRGAGRVRSPAGRARAAGRSPRISSRSVHVRPGRPRTCSCAATRSRPSAGSARCARTPTSSSAGASRSAAWRSSTGPDAVVAHRDPEDVVAVVRQAAGYGAGRRWLRSSYGPAVPAPTLRSPARAGRRAERSPGRWRCGSSAPAFKLVDGLVAAATWVGYRLGDNRA